MPSYAWAEENSNNHSEKTEQSDNKEKTDNTGHMKVTENVDEEGKNFNPDVSPEKLKGKKQFLTFVTQDNKTYHIVVSYNATGANVQLLKEVTNEDLAKMTGNGNNALPAPTQPNQVGKTTDQLERDKQNSQSTKQSNQKNDDKKNEDKEKSSSGNLILYLVFAIAVGGIAFWRIKSKNRGGFDDED